MMTRSLSAAFERLLSSRAKPKRSAKLKAAAKTVVRTALGDTKYRKLWRMAGARKEPLPTLPELDRPLRILHLINSAGFYGAESMLLNLATASNAEGCRNIIGVFRNLRNLNT